MVFFDQKTIKWYKKWSFGPGTLLILGAQNHGFECPQGVQECLAGLDGGHQDSSIIDQN